MTRQFFAQNPSVPWFLALLTIFTLMVSVLSEGMGVGVLSTSLVKILGMTLCLCLIAIAMDVVWGYCGILSLGHFAFFGLGGYAIGMWLMYARTEIVIRDSMEGTVLPPTAEELSEAVAAQIFGVVGSSDLPLIWSFAHSLPAQLALVVLVPGVLALVFGWLAFRSRVTGVYLSILTQADLLALSLYLFQNDTGLRGNNGLSGLQNIPGSMCYRRFLRSGSFGLRHWPWVWVIFLFAWVVSGKFGSVIIRAIRDNESRARFLDITLKPINFFVFTLTAIISGLRGRFTIRRRASSTPAELAPIA